MPFWGLKHIRMVEQISSPCIFRTFQISLGKPFSGEALIPLGPLHPHFTFYLWVWLLLLLYVDQIKRFLAFCDRVLSLTMMTSKFLYVLACVCFSLFFCCYMKERNCFILFYYILFYYFFIILLLNEFIAFVVVQWSSQSSFIGFPSHTPSTFSQPPTWLLWKP